MTETVLQNLPWFWAAIGVIFVLLEVMTATFYGLAVALAAFATALFTWLAGTTTWSLPQFIVFLVASILLCVFLPRMFAKTHVQVPVGLEAAVGRTARLIASGNQWKIEIDGVNYLVSENSTRPDFSAGKTVKITGVQGGLPTVE